MCKLSWLNVQSVSMEEKCMNVKGDKLLTLIVKYWKHETIYDPINCDINVKIH